MNLTEYQQMAKQTTENFQKQMENIKNQYCAYRAKFTIGRSCQLKGTDEIVTLKSYIVNINDGNILYSAIKADKKVSIYSENELL